MFTVTLKIFNIKQHSPIVQIEKNFNDLVSAFQFAKQYTLDQNLEDWVGYKITDFKGNILKQVRLGPNREEITLLKKALDLIENGKISWNKKKGEYITENIKIYELFENYLKNNKEESKTIEHNLISDIWNCLQDKELISKVWPKLEGYFLD